MFRNVNFQTSLKRMLDSQDGMFVLKCLKEDYIDVSCVSEDVSKTMYLLGKKELVQDWINSLDDDETLSDINTNQ